MAAIRNIVLHANHSPVLLRSEMCRPKGRNGRRGGGGMILEQQAAQGQQNSRAACTLLCSLGSSLSRSAVPGSEPATARLVTSL